MTLGMRSLVMVPAITLMVAFTCFGWLMLVRLYERLGAGRASLDQDRWA